MPTRRHSSPTGRTHAFVKEILLAMLLVVGGSLIHAAQKDAVEEREPFRLDLPEIEIDPADLPPELRPLNIVRPVLPEEVAQEVAELQARVSELEETGLAAVTRSEQDAALDEAVTLAARVLEIRRRHQGPASESGAAWAAVVATARGDRAGDDVTPAMWYEVKDVMCRIEFLRRLRGLEAEARADLMSMGSLDEQVNVLYAAAKYAGALEIVERQIEVRSQFLGQDHPDTLNSMVNMGVLLQAQGDLAAAEPYKAGVVAAFRRVLGDDHPDTLNSISNMGFFVQGQGDLSAAMPYYAEALAGRRRVLGDDHGSTLLSINNMGYVLQAQGKLYAAELCYGVALAGYRRTLGDGHPGTLRSVSNMGFTLMSQGELRAAEPYLMGSLAGHRCVLGDDHPSTQTSLNNVALFLQAKGELSAAEPLHAETLARRRRVLGDDHPLTLTAVNNVGCLLHHQGQLAAAEPYYHESLAGSRRVLGDDHMDTLTSIENMGQLLHAQGRFADAERYYSEALAGRRRVLGDDHPETLISISSMGTLKKDKGDLAAADPYYTEALAGSRRVLGDEHSSTLVRISHMGHFLRAKGDLAAAESCFAEALAGWRRVLGDDHPSTLSGIASIGGLMQTRGDLAAAEPYFVEAIATAERLRIDVIGGVEKRAAFSGKLELAGIAVRYAMLLAETDRPAEALAVVERGRGRAALDLVGREAGDIVAALAAVGDTARVQRYEAAATREQEAIIALRESEAKWKAGADHDDDAKAELNEIVKQRRRELGERTRAVFAELRGLVPAGDPLTSEQILVAVEPGSALLSFLWTDDRLLTLIARDGAVEAVTVADGKAEIKALRDAIGVLRATIATRASSGMAVYDALTAARGVLVPDTLRDAIAGAQSLTVIPDGPLHDVPLELLLPEMPIAYAPSATIAIDRQRAARERDDPLHGALVLGAPDFGTEPGALLASGGVDDLPEEGILLTMVTEGSNAGIAGLQRGDVLLRYGDHQLTTAGDLGPAIQAAAEKHAEVADGGDKDRPITAEIWRDGARLEVALATGRMGVRPSRAPPAEGLRSMAFFDTSTEERSADASTLDQIRLYGGSLSALPGTRREAEVVASILGTTPIVDQDATAPYLRDRVFAGAPRYLHLATHGLTGNAQRPYEASLALTRPEEPTSEDIGFLTLDELLTQWLGRLRGTEIVTLSACDTGRGVAQGDSMMALPLGFFTAGAETVVASLWRVDDTATAMLMARFYANLLGKTESSRTVDGSQYGTGQPMPKLAALREAKAWLRGLTAEDAKTTRDALDAGDARAQIAAVTRGPQPVTIAEAGDADRPYAHPYFWAAFVLYGSPE